MAAEPGRTQGLRGVVAALADGIVVVDRAGRIRFANPAACELLGRPLATLAGADFGFPVRPSGVADIELLVGDRRRIVETRSSPGRWGGEPAVVVSLRDVTARARAVAEIEEVAREALRDPLTGLPNRSLLLDRIHQALARSDRTGATVVVMFVDLDDFKRLNDTFGHEAGDEVLRAVARHLRSAVRPADTVCRLGGDEFVVVCETLDGGLGAEDLAARMEAAITVPCPVDGHELSVTASVGVATACSGATPESLLGDADAAMYLAKHQGKARHRVFDETMRDLVSERARLETGLAEAIETRRLRLVYQPVLTLAGRETIGAEALLRYVDPERGVLVADEFIGVAEAGGLVVGLGGWALEQACRDAAAWARRGRPLPVTVNVGATQLASANFVSTVEAALEHAGLPADLLCIDLTEAAAESTGSLAGTIRKLGDTGVRLGVDDWGTGNASLTALAQLPLTYVKIDPSAVAGLGSGIHTARALVAAAHALGLAVLAEGVESEEQLRLMRRLGCKAGQGHHLGLPVPSGALVDRLAATAPPA